MFVRLTLTKPTSKPISSSILKCFFTTRRRRQHINPFSGRYAVLTPSSDSLQWIANKGKANKETTFHLDLGCGSGNYLSDLAVERPTINYVGVEIKEQLVDIANQRHAQLLPNLLFIWANLLNPQTLSSLLNSFPAGQLQSISILHPDPNYKNRHMKRDYVTKDFLSTLGNHLLPGARVYIQTDVEEVDTKFKEVFDSLLVQQQMFEEVNLKEVEMLVEEGKNGSLLGVPTDREKSVLKAGGVLYRRTYVKC